VDLFADLRVLVVGKAGSEYDLNVVVLAADMLDLIEDVAVDEVEGVLVRRQQEQIVLGRLLQERLLYHFNYACSARVVRSVQVQLDSVLSELVDKGLNRVLKTASEKKMPVSA
jgi:hypothetical protein